MRAYRVCRVAFVDVVTQMDDQVATARDHIAIRVVVALLVVLAARDAHPKHRSHRSGGVGSPSSADRAHMVAGAESVVELASRWQAADFEVHAVTVSRHGDDRTGLNAAREVRIRCDFVGQDEIRIGQFVGRIGAGCDTGPENHAVIGGVARGDAEGKGIRCKLAQAQPGSLQGSRREGEADPGHRRLQYVSSQGHGVRV